MNNITLMGRLATEPELKKTNSGVPVCSFMLAVKRPHANDTTDFIRCVAWRKSGEFIKKYFHKGKMISVNGYLTSFSYEGNDGEKRYGTEVCVEYSEFCGDSAAAKEKSEV